MAKIPIILEAGRADGKLATSNNIFDENKGMFQSEINDIQDTLNSDNPNKPLSAKQGKVLKELLNAKVIEVGAVPIDTKPTEGNTTHVVNSDGLAKEFNKCKTTIITTDRISDGAVTTEKIATTAFDSTLSVSEKIAPADVVGEKITSLGEQSNNYSNSAIIVGIANTQGQLTSNLNFYRTTDFIKIVRGQYYYIKTKVVTPWTVATFYANDKSFVGKYILGGESTQEISEYEGYSEIDGFIRVSTMYDTINDFVFILGSKEYVEIKEIVKQYARAVRGKNLFNAKNITNGYLNSAGTISPGNNVFATGYIPVTGNLVCNKNNPAGTYNCVYGKDYTFIRNFISPNYTYQEGDAYVRYSGNKDLLESYQIEEGDVSTDYFPYTDKQDAIDIIKENVLPNYFPYHFISDRSNNYAGITFNISNPSGNTKRKYGMDITKGASKGFVETMLFNNDKVVGKYKTSITFICNHDSIKKFGDFGQTKEQLGKGLFKFSKITEISDTPKTISHIIMCEAPKDDSLIYIRLLSVDIEALDESAKSYVKRYCDKYPYDFNVIEKDIYHGFDSTTEGWGINKFSSLIDAVNSTSNLKDLTRQYIYRIMPGEYREWETQWKGSDSETGESAYGVSPKGNSVIESFDTDVPELVKLAWDGHVGFSDGYIMTVAQCMRRCILHISTDLYCKTIIDGLSFDTKNVRYCIHPESSGNGFGNAWLIKNCILHDGGRPQGTGVSLPIGIGISPGEYGHVHRCNILSSTGQGIGGHDNPNNRDVAYPLLYGGNLVVEECNLNDNNIQFSSIYDDANTPFQLSVKGCGNVKDIITRTANDKPNQWRVSVICSDFKSIQEDL